MLLYCRLYHKNQGHSSQHMHARTGARTQERTHTYKTWHILLRIDLGRELDMIGMR